MGIVRCNKCDNNFSFLPWSAVNAIVSIPTKSIVALLNDTKLIIEPV